VPPELVNICCPFSWTKPSATTWKPWCATRRSARRGALEQTKAAGKFTQAVRDRGPGGVEGSTFVALQAALGTKVLGDSLRLGDELGLAALTTLAEDLDLLDSVAPWHRDATDMTLSSPPLELWDGEGASPPHVGGDAWTPQGKLTAVMRDPTLDPTVRREAARVRRAFGQLIKDPDLAAEGPADGP
jgi:hypothetical protein